MRVSMLVFVTLLVGCYSSPPQPPLLLPEPPVLKVEKPAPPKEKVEPVYSQMYINGYNDGYAGNWLAPARWLIGDDYRAGRSAGVRDRTNNLPNKFEKK